MTNKKKYYFLFLLKVITISIFAQNNYNSAILKFVNDESLKHASIGINIRSVIQNKILVEYNSELFLTPASVLKVVTTSSALAILGKDFKFKTYLSFSGKINDKNELLGDIYIIGGGDPTFGSNRFDTLTSINSIYNKWYLEITRLGIRSIKGKIISVPIIFDNNIVPNSWIWEDIGNYYGCGISGLSINENSYDIFFESGSTKGDTTKITNINPEIEYLTHKNFVISDSINSDNVIIYGAPFSDFKKLKGSIPLNKKSFKVKASLPDPAFYVAYSFSKFITEKGIKQTEKPIVIENNKKYSYYTDSLHIISEHYSPSLDSIIYWTNIKSINIYAEALLKMVGYKVKNTGSYNAGIETIKEYFASKKLNLYLNSDIKDGSGLSPLNKITAKTLTDLLVLNYKESYFDVFYNSLPVGGVSGSIENIFKGTAAENNIHSKSGYMKGVRSYAGYITTSNNDLLAFSIIVNNFQCSNYQMKQMIEKLILSFYQ